MHPGQSENYKKMKLTRAKRSLDRQAFKLAKERLREKFDEFNITRSRIRYLKKKILTELKKSSKI